VSGVNVQERGGGENRKKTEGEVKNKGGLKLLNAVGAKSQTGQKKGTAGRP